MAVSLTTLRTRVYTRIRADMGTPAVNNVDDASIETWANEKTSVVIQILQDPRYFNQLVVNNQTVTLSSGAGSLPSDFEFPVGVRVKTSAVDGRRARLLPSLDDFNLFDDSNFITKATDNWPVAVVANGKLLVKPTSITTAYLDYIKKHPTIDNSNGTVWGELADQVLLELIMAEYYSFLEEYDLAAKAEAKARSYAGASA